VQRCSINFTIQLRQDQVTPSGEGSRRAALFVKSHDAFCRVSASVKPAAPGPYASDRDVRATAAMVSKALQRMIIHSPTPEPFGRIHPSLLLVRYEEVLQGLAHRIDLIGGKRPRENSLFSNVPICVTVASSPTWVIKQQTGIRRVVDLDRRPV
jgi:hypothetical protein